MNRDKSIDKPMKPRRREPQRSRRSESGGNIGGHQNPVLVKSRDSVDQVPYIFQFEKKEEPN
ncbi:hypothetical protein DEO72_LG2g546 [Vigna unguiculata]|uniref:Uncharacterized protein n=1 Tax=Vigna unguiculata TaxID=3917 RepID=A0A4D6KV17_VIGUN|nr:hypothetical protein DEO72_LG2g546 [Vigna unguiculata]